MHCIYASYYCILNVCYYAHYCKLLCNLHNPTDYSTFHICTCTANGATTAIVVLGASFCIVLCKTQNLQLLRRNCKTTSSMDNATINIVWGAHPMSPPINQDVLLRNLYLTRTLRNAQDLHVVCCYINDAMSKIESV